MLSKVSVCGLGVRGVLMFDDAAGDVGGIGVEGGSAVREELPNRNLVIRFSGGILMLFIKFKLV